MFEVALNRRFEKSERTFLISAGVTLASVGLAKLLAASGTAEILAYHDPILGVPFRLAFIAVGFLELLIATMCLTSRLGQFSLLAIAWLASNFAAYRLGLWLVGWKRPCGCLGNLTDSLHISSSTADWIAKAIIVYLLVGSYILLVFGKRERGQELRLRLGRSAS